MIIVIDYGLGNIKSVSRAMEKVGAEITVSSDPSDISSASGVVLPGVGERENARGAKASGDLGLDVGQILFKFGCQAGGRASRIG